jgi:hypothetical protein
MDRLPFFKINVEKTFPLADAAKAVEYQKK